jgi:regulator of sirC expression with transglutaminase-like and TPR domain
MFVTCRVFETGLGIPISLSVIAVAVGRGAGLSMACVNAPGHFMAKLDPGGTAPVHYLDAFEGSIMDRWPCNHALLRMLFGTAHIDSTSSSRMLRQAKLVCRTYVRLVWGSYATTQRPY